MDKIIERLKKMFHVHDYEMEFEDPSRPLDWTFRCRCGDTATDMETARKRMRQITHIGDWSF